MGTSEKITMCIILYQFLKTSNENAPYFFYLIFNPLVGMHPGMVGFWSDPQLHQIGLAALGYHDPQIYNCQQNSIITNSLSTETSNY